MERTFDVEWLNGIVNHPDIYPYVHGEIEGPIDMAPAIENHDNIVMRSPDGKGGWLFHGLGNGIYECHSQFLPEGRGPHVVGLAHETLDYMFDKTDAEIILARCPMNNEPVIKLTKACGFKYIGTWGDWTINGEPVPTERYQLTKETWKSIRAKQKK